MPLLICSRWYIKKISGGWVLHSNFATSIGRNKWPMCCCDIWLEVYEVFCYRHLQFQIFQQCWRKPPLFYSASPSTTFPGERFQGSVVIHPSAAIAAHSSASAKGVASTTHSSLSSSQFFRVFWFTGSGPSEELQVRTARLGPPANGRVAPKPRRESWHQRHRYDQFDHLLTLKPPELIILL